MKIEYYPETDSLYIDLGESDSANSVEVADGVVIDLDKNGSIVGIDIDHASKKLNLSQIETVSLPAKTVKVG
ncbi:MAG: DUF2283 domain-containing protein [Planctomycetota bacterium]|nr:DUF2283 domain-containing protein [Planctomycetota bacterium]